MLGNSLPKDGGGQLIDVVDEGLSAVRGAERRRAAPLILSIPLVLPTPPTPPEPPEPSPASFSPRMERAALPMICQSVTSRLMHSAAAGSACGVDG